MTNQTKPQFEEVNNKRVIINAPAKINLSLLIGAKREDGFHEVHTVMSKIDLMDRLILEKTDSPEIELKCTGQYEAPETADNLVYKAATLMGVTENLKITLEKNIPAGAGLAGGSSDAAATLMGLNKLFDLGLSDEQLKKHATVLGSDIAFFIDGPLALCTGRGEIIKKISENHSFSTLLFLPDVNSSTKKIYGNFRPDLTLFEQQKNKINYFIEKNTVDLIAKMCANMLENSCFENYPELAGLKSEIQSLTNTKVCLSGSGSAMYLLPEKEIIDLYKQKDILERKLSCKVILISNNRW